MKKLFCILLLCPLFVTTAYADKLTEELAEESGVYAVESALPQEERDVSGALRLDGGYDTKGALARLWERLLTSAREQLHGELRYAAGLVAIAVFCSLGGSLTASKSIQEYIQIAGCGTAALLMAGSLDGIIAQATGTLTQLSDYSKAAMPALFTAAAACGAAITASARYGAVCLAMDVFISAAQRFIIPLIYAYLAIAISSSIFDNPLLRAASRIAKWCAVTAMTAITLAFSAYIGITGVITGSSDALAVKTTRTVIAGLLPVVGGIIADSAGVVLTAAEMIKNATGAFSLIAVCALCASPFAVLLVKMLVFKAAAAAADLLPGGRLSKLIDEVGTAFGMLLGLVGSSAVMLFISIMSGIRVVTAS